MCNRNWRVAKVDLDYVHFLISFARDSDSEQPPWQHKCVEQEKEKKMEKGELWI